MAHGIIRVRSITAREIGATYIHNERRYQEHDLPVPENIYPEGKGPYGIYGSNMHTSYKTINQRLKETGVKVRKNSVHAIEYVIGASPDFFAADVYSVEGYLSHCLAFLKKKHGIDNIISIHTHYDESTPHMHVIVTPIVEKEVKFKNRYGEGTRKENRLCARDFIGDKHKLRQLQDDFFLHVKPIGEAYNVPFYRGTLAEKQLKQYTRETNHELGQIRSKIASISNELKKMELRDELKKKSQEFVFKTINLQKKISQRQKWNRKGGWKKGKDFDIGF